MKEDSISVEFTKQYLETRTVLIYGEINQALAEKVSNQLVLLKHSNDNPVNILINSQGGHVEAGDTIGDMIKFIDLPINMIGTGWVASAGAMIYLSAPKENRFALPNTRFMIHQPSGGTSGQATDISIEAEEIIKMRKRINVLISDATGQPLSKVADDTDRNYWMDPSEAINYGIVSRVINSVTEIN